MVKTIGKDVKFLQDCRFMDYSILFAILRVEDAHDIGQENKRLTLNESFNDMVQQISPSSQTNMNRGSMCDEGHMHPKSETDHDEEQTHDLNPPREDGEMTIN